MDEFSYFFATPFKWRLFWINNHDFLISLKFVLNMAEGTCFRPTNRRHHFNIKQYCNVAHHFHAKSVRLIGTSYSIRIFALFYFLSIIYSSKTY